MNKQEFLKELELLLADIPEEEKNEALDFYNSYFEDAGPENESNVLEELGSAKQVAASIKRELINTQVYTSDEMFSNQNADTEEKSANANNYRDPYSCSRKPDYSSYQSNNSSSYNQTNKSYDNSLKSRLEGWDFYRNNKGLCIVLLILLLVFTSPIWGGALAALFGLSLGLLGIIFGLIAACASLALAGFVGGVSLIIIGAGTFVVSLGTGLFLVGLGIIFVAFGILFTAATLAICGRFLPWCIKSIVNAFRGNTYKTGGATA